ncbi:hypothetical protein GEV33_010178 [Tenebrio molitor]|uniref:Uncharacterized protein n=1 Tax=Tenebrio molitor TaxID=7067 RepID=A0A8J6HFB1_TENMO|nr:hypothetical protein GEV33_010178 [Tenebrio molitor]
MGFLRCLSPLKKRHECHNGAVSPGSDRSLSCPNETAKSGCAVTALIERVEDEAPSWAPGSRWAAITRSGANQSRTDRTFLLQASRSVARSGYLFVAPDWDFSVPLNRTKRDFDADSPKDFKAREIKTQYTSSAGDCLAVKLSNNRTDWTGMDRHLSRTNPEFFFLPLEKSFHSLTNTMGVTFGNRGRASSATFRNRQLISSIRSGRRRSRGPPGRLAQHLRGQLANGNVAHCSGDPVFVERQLTENLVRKRQSGSVSASFGSRRREKERARQVQLGNG